MSDIQTTPTSGDTPQRSLSRGQACLICRQRKIKCDGARPACSQCIRSRRKDECEYEGQVRSRQQQLEEEIMHLKARLDQFESQNPVVSSSILLHNPHTAFNAESFGSLVAPSPVSRAPSASSSSVTEANSKRSYSWPRADDIPEIITEDPSILLDTFLQNVDLLPWFLHKTRFRTSFLLSQNNLARPIPMLHATVCVWGSLFTRSRASASDARSHLSRALSLAEHGLAGALPENVLQFIQAHLLLAAYFYHTGQFFEGRYYTGAAAALAMQCGLHVIRSAQPFPPLLPSVRAIELTLPVTQDAIEEGERINGFWAVFQQDRIWAVALGAPTIIGDGYAGSKQIDTPWPLDMELYERNTIYPEMRTHGTLRSFFDGTNSAWPWETDGIQTQVSKASALIERATRLSTSWRPGMQDSTTYYAELIALDQRIEEFKAQLFPLLSLAPLAAQQMHTVHCLAHAATIQLHATFTQQNSASRAKCLNAATSILRASATVHIQTYTFIDPIIGSIWAAVGRVLINEISTSRSLFAQSGDQLIIGREAELIGALDGVQNMLANFAPRSPAMSYHFNQVQGERIVL